MEEDCSMKNIGEEDWFSNFVVGCGFSNYIFQIDLYSDRVIIAFLIKGIFVIDFLVENLESLSLDLAFPFEK